MGILAVTLGVYAMIKHYLGAEYFAPLFFTDWVEAFFTQGLFGGLKYTFGKLYYMGKASGDIPFRGSGQVWPPVRFLRVIL